MCVNTHTHTHTHTHACTLTNLSTHTQPSISLNPIRPISVTPTTSPHRNHSPSHQEPQQKQAKILKSQLATRFTIEKHYGADVFSILNHKILQQPLQQHARALTPAPFIRNGSSTPMGAPQSSPAYTHARTHANPHSSENLRKASSAASPTESAASGVSFVCLGVQMWDESFIRIDTNEGLQSCKM